MLPLADPGLPAATAAKLSEYQGEIDAIPDYEARVLRGKNLFKSRNSRSNSTFRVVREKLSEMCSGAQRCVYCEDSVGDEVEHIKPKDLYPEAVFAWPNYIFACGPCNGEKNRRFAVMTATGRVDVTRRSGEPVRPPIPGRPAFIDPRKENPLDLLTMDLQDTFLILPENGLSADSEKRAEFTIEVLGLNRHLLLEARRNAFGGFRARLSEYRQRRDRGADAAELNALRNDLLGTPHPTVWEEMKRQSSHSPELSDLFADVPEAIGWSPFARPAG